MFLGTNKLPDLRGMFLRGLDTTGNVDRDGKTRPLLSFQEGTRHFSENVGYFASPYATSQPDGSNTMSNLGLDPLASATETHTICVAASARTESVSASQFNNLTGLGDTGTWDMISVERPKNIAVNYLIKARITENGKDGDFVPVRATKAIKVTSNGNLTFDTLKVSNPIVDVPGTTSNTVPTTSWVDQNYANLKSLANSFSGVPIGVPTPWASNTLPPNCAICDGSSFNGTSYPVLYTLFPTGKLPDLRGMFIRGLDTSGNVDNFNGTRSLLSFEEGSRISGEWSVDISNLNNIQASFSSRIAGMQALGWDASQNQNETFPSGHIPVLGGTVGGQSVAAFSHDEILGITRPKNVAFNYIVRLI